MSRPIYAPGALPRLSDLLRVNDAGLKAVLVEWLQGCLVASSLEEALAQRAQLQPGQTLLVVESMKMEIPVEAPAAGTVRELRVAEGEAVKDGQWLATLD